MRTRIVNRSVSAIALAIGIATTGILPLQALTIQNLTTANTTTVFNGATFTTTDNQSTGTGVIDSFVRLQQNGSEEGYNSSTRPVMPDVNTDPNFTRNLQLGEIPIVNGAYEFVLDINQTAANPFLSLNEFQLYTSAGPLAVASVYPPIATLVYDMDRTGGFTVADNTNDYRLQLNYNLASGSGSGDLFVYVPTSFFGNLGGSTYVTLYSKFGTEAGDVSFSSNDGFEEWSIRTATPSTPPSVPEGGATAILLGSTLLGLAFIQRRVLI